MKCEDCFYSKEDGNGSAGYVLCRRFPPVPVVMVIGGGTRNRSHVDYEIPRTGWNSWCGEFKPKEAA